MDEKKIEVCGPGTMLEEFCPPVQEEWKPCDAGTFERWLDWEFGWRRTIIRRIVNSLRPKCRAEPEREA